MSLTSPRRPDALRPKYGRYYGFEYAPPRNAEMVTRPRRLPFPALHVGDLAIQAERTIRSHSPRPGFSGNGRTNAERRRLQVSERIRAARAAWSNRAHCLGPNRATREGARSQAVDIVYLRMDAPGVEPLRSVPTETREDADLPTKPTKSFGQVAPVRSRAVPPGSVLRCRVGAQGGHKISRRRLASRSSRYIWIHERTRPEGARRGSRPHG